MFVTQFFKNNFCFSRFQYSQYLNYITFDFQQFIFIIKMGLYDYWLA